MGFLDRACGKPKHVIKQMGDYRNYPYPTHPSERTYAVNPLPAMRPFRFVMRTPVLTHG